MKKVNFKELSIYKGISKREKVIGDARESFADILYSQSNGIRSHSLALKIFESDGEIEVTTEEEQLIVSIAERFCTPAFIDGLMEQLKPLNNETNL
ncbi:MAG: hypothetical protein ACRCUJ_14295 [Phocaeicola sp.]